MNLNLRRLLCVLFIIAMTCPIVSWGDDAAKTIVTNPSLESLRRNKESHVKTTEKINAGGGATFDPEGLVVRRYDEAIAKAEKIIASGGTFERKDLSAAMKVIHAESTLVNQRFRQQAKERMRKADETFDREMAEIKKESDKSKSAADAKYQRAMAQADLTFRLKMSGGKLGVMIWNLPATEALHERWTESVRVELLQKDRVVWTKRLLRLDRRKDNNPIRLPNVLFDKVKIEALSWTGRGSGFAEIEVYAGSENIALGRSCKVSSIETLPIHLDDRDALTDGIMQPTEVGVGYWIPEEETKATVTIDLLSEPNKDVIAAAKARASKAPIR